MLIKIKRNSIEFSKKLLGTEEAWLWVGTSYGPKDNDDTRVKETRELMQKYYPYIPYGMWIGNKEAEQTRPLKDTANSGYYTADLSWWPAGAYRMNLHTKVGEESPLGSQLHPEKRDQECSWASLESGQWNTEESASIRPFIHKEENGAGSSIRILIRPDRSIEAFGDLA